MLDLLREKPADVLDKLHELYYRDRTQELDREIQALEEKLEGVDAEFLMNEFTEMSLCCFRAHLAERYGKQSQRPVFSKEALWKTPGNVLEEYPVVLSTTYTARSSLGKYARFDYVAMDEASQVDVATGCLALSCARNAVIVGDTNSCLSAIAAKRLHIPIFHMEAGNRCKDECLPEETNRRIVDIISDVNLAYFEHARKYLHECGLPKERVYVTGSPMAEVLHQNLAEIEASDVHEKLGLEKGKYILLSAHRGENIDTEKNLSPCSRRSIRWQKNMTCRFFIPAILVPGTV